MGDGWCDSTIECYERSLTKLGTTTLWDDKAEFYGMFSSNSMANPDFYNWNAAVFIYCDGASFAGNR